MHSHPVPPAPRMYQRDITGLTRRGEGPLVHHRCHSRPDVCLRLSAFLFLPCQGRIIAFTRNIYQLDVPYEGLVIFMCNWLSGKGRIFRHHRFRFIILYTIPVTTWRAFKLSTVFCRPGAIRVSFIQAGRFQQEIAFILIKIKFQLRRVLRRRGVYLVQRYRPGSFSCLLVWLNN